MSHDDHSLPQDVPQLQAMLLAERANIAVLSGQHETAIAQHLSSLAEYKEGSIQSDKVIETQHVTIDRLTRKIEGLQQQLAQFLRKLYGPQRERIDPNQLTLFSAEELQQLVSELQQGIVDSVSTDDGSEADDTSPDAAATGAASPPTPPKPKGHGRRPLPEHIPRETVIHELSDAERLCPCCGKLRKEIGSATSEQLEYIPASLKVIVNERRKYACESCEEHVAIAAKPPQPIERGLPGPALIAHTVLSKYGDYLPLYRQEDILARHGIIIRRSTLCDWVAAAADVLQPLYDLMCDRVRLSKVIHSDDTSIKLLSTPKCQNCKFWIYAGDASNPYAVYEFSLTREGKEPSRFLRGFKGYLQADGYSGYDEVYSSGDVIEVGCMAHCRRYWWEAKGSDSRRAHAALAYIGRLYALEEKFRELKLSGDGLRDARQKHANPILDQFAVWIQTEASQVLPKSEIGKAFTYTQNQWQALRRYTEDGVLSIDNNLAERLMKIPAIGRKNYLFVGSEEGGRRAAILMSIIASAKRCHVEPLAWISELLRELPRRRASCEGDPPASNTEQPQASASLTDLLPDEWLVRHPEHRWAIDDLRQKEREKTRQAKTGQ